METCFLKKNQKSFFASLKKVLVFVEFFIVFSSFRVWATDSQAWRWCENSGKWSNPDGSTNKVWEYYNLTGWKEDASAGDYPGKEATTTSYNDSACFLGTNSCTLDVDVATRLEALYINSDIKESIGTIPQKPSAGTVGSGSVTFNFTNTVDNNNGSVTAKNIYIGDYSVLEGSYFNLELNGQGRIDAVENLHFEKGYSYTIKISENVTFFAKKIVFEGSSEKATTINFTGNGTIEINEVDCADSKVVFKFNQSVDLKNSVFYNSKLLELNFSSGDGNLKTVSIGKSNESLVCHSVLIGKNVSLNAESGMIFEINKDESGNKGIFTFEDGAIFSYSGTAITLKSDGILIKNNASGTASVNVGNIFFTGDSDFDGSFEVADFTIDSSANVAESFVNFKDDSSLTINGSVSLKGNSEENRLILNSFTSSAVWNVNFTETLTESNFSFVTVKNSNSATDLGFCMYSQNVLDGGGNTNWFLLNYTWKGTVNFDLSENSNWEGGKSPFDSVGSISEKVILTVDTELNGNDFVLTSDIKINELIVNDEKKLCLSSFVLCANSISIGKDCTVVLEGTQNFPALKLNSSLNNVEWGENSTIEYSGNSNEAKLVLCNSQSGTEMQFCNLVIKKPFLAENEISVSKNLEVIFAENVVFEKKLTVLGVASFTDFKTVELKESNSFEKLSFKIENSTNSATVKFGAGKTQTVNKTETASFSCLGKKDCFITLTTDSASPSKDDKTSWWRLDSSVLALDFSFVQVEYSNSVQDFTNFAWNFDSVKESEPYSTENWFARKFYWIGNSSSDWNEKENWALDFAGSITSWTVPNSQDGKSQIVILKGSSNSAVPFILKMGGQASGQTSYKLKSIEVESGASLDFCGSSVEFSAEDSSKVLKNKGEILLFGNETFLFEKRGTKISAENITNEKGSTIVYYGDNSTHSYWELPFGTSYENLVFETTAKGFIKDLIDWNDKILVKSLENAVSFLDLTVKSGRTFEIADKSVSEGCEVCVLRNLTVENDAKFVNGGKLVLGCPSSDALGGIDGTISDENADSIDFGNVEIKQGFAKKTFTTSFKSTVLKMDESSATGEIAFEKKLTVLLQTNGFSNVAGNFAVSFKSGAEIPCGASFCTTGEVSLAGSFNFSDKDLKIGNKTKILGNVDFSANNVEFLGDVFFKTDCKNVQTSKNQIFGGKISVEEDSSVQTSEKRIVFKSSQGDFHLKNGFESVGNGEVEFLCEDSEKGTFIGSPTQTSADVVLRADSIVFESNLFINTGKIAENPFKVEFKLNSASVGEQDSLVKIDGTFVLFNGNLVFGENCNGISAQKDIVLLNGNSATMYNDTNSTESEVASGVKNLFAYINFSRIGKTASPSISTFPKKMPDSSSIGIDESFSSIIENLSGKTLQTFGNFYNNGVNLLADSEWFLRIPSNDKATSNFAECYNAEIKNCTVNCIDSAGNKIDALAFVSAAENCVDGGKNSQTQKTGVYFKRPKVVFAKTVSDSVIFVQFDSKIENSENEILKSVKNIKNSSGQAIGTFTDELCSQSTNGQGDLSEFYLKFEEKDSWNTDATGLSSGETYSTNFASIHKETVPYLEISKALQNVYETLRDEHKNRIAHHVDEKKLTLVEDFCPPVLVKVRTGQELHLEVELQKSYDAHNFIEFAYSEPVKIGEFELENDLLESFSEEQKNRNTNVKASEQLGKVTNSGANGFSISGLGTFNSGTIVTGSLGTEDNSIHSLYRIFSDSANDAVLGKELYFSNKIRFALAGYVDSTVSVDSVEYNHWQGYISFAKLPSGLVEPIENSFIKDKKGNILKHKNSKLEIKVDSSIKEEKLYGIWDISAPIFAAYLSSDPEKIETNAFEISGTNADGKVVLDKIEFHIHDNSQEDAQWYTQVGWAEKQNPEVLKTNNSYAADIFGGSRSFSSAKNRTSGGIRYSTLYNKASCFKYYPDFSVQKGTLDFDENCNIEGGAKSSFFYPAISTSQKNSTGGADGLYFGIKLKSDSNLPLKSTFTVTYDGKGFITDLAGNLLEAKTVHTIDSVDPRFELTLAEVNGNQLYVVFNKKINVGEVVVKTDLHGSVTGNTATSLRFVKISEDGTPYVLTNSDSDYLAVDSVKEVVFCTERFTGIIYNLNRAVTYSDLKNMYLQCFSPEKGRDPVSGVTGVDVTFIQTDTNVSADKTFMPHGMVRPLSDFAIGVVNPLVAYDGRLNQENSTFSKNLYDENSYAVHDWNEEQNKFGTLAADCDINLKVELKNLESSENPLTLPIGATLFASSTKKLSAVAKTYNEAIVNSSLLNWRFWLPSSSENADILSQSKNAEKDFSILFELENSAIKKYSWTAGNQIGFVFGLFEQNAGVNVPVSIYRSPIYDSSSNTYDLGESSAIYALRLKNPKDLTSLDMWSFKLEGITLQRGGVTIMNNVIDASKGEKAVLQLDMASSGNVNIMVMTLDGNIVRYLHHGTLSGGTHSFTWNGTTNSGKTVAKGLYFIRITGNGIDETRKVMVVKQQ